MVIFGKLNVAKNIKGFCVRPSTVNVQMFATNWELKFIQIGRKLFNLPFFQSQLSTAPNRRLRAHHKASRADSSWLKRCTIYSKPLKKRTDREDGNGQQHAEAGTEVAVQMADQEVIPGGEVPICGEQCQSGQWGAEVEEEATDRWDVLQGEPIGAEKEGQFDGHIDGHHGNEQGREVGAELWENHFNLSFWSPRIRACDCFQSMTEVDKKCWLKSNSSNHQQ